MNDFLAQRYSEIVHRLAVGIAPYDAVRSAFASSRLELHLLKPAGLKDVRLERHPSARWAVRYVPRIPATIDVLIADPSRRYVPRRMQFPVVDEAQVRAAEAAGSHVPAAERTWWPALFPGAAYPLSSATAAIRGRARIAGTPARWTRVLAVAQGTNRVLGRGHGDDRGEFLLIVAPDPAAPAELPASVTVTVTVRARKPAPAPPPDPDADPFWDMPLEAVSAPGPSDPVSAGLQDPAGYTPGFTATRDVVLVPGRAPAGVDPFDLV